ncbi:MAG: serpin family protein [Synergistaceae bacterium]|jgi:serpin B|nr:serpin family protein [Synergistaceae bacterium]
MRCILCVLLACLIVTFFLRGPASASPTPDGSEAAVVVNAFAIDIYRQLSEEKGNVFFSPYSIVSALAMTWAGARGDTAREMAEALHFTGVEPVLHASMKALQDRFNSIPEESGVLEVANRLWLDKKQKLLPDYTALLGENYGGGVESVDFQKDRERARATINEWVERKTRDKIKDLLHEGDVTSSIRLILTNAIYFNSAWMEPFNAKLTKEEPFHIGQDRQKNVPMMRRTDFFLYGERPDLQWIKIPYSMPGFSLLVLLPRANESFTQLEELEKKLTSQELALWVGGVQRSKVSLWLPKFKNNARYVLSGVLQKLGMNLAFTSRADFSGMVEDPHNDEGDFHINFVIHQSFVDLDERGTEAAAATAVGMVRTTSFSPDREEPIEFRADRPFIYCLMDDSTGAILFMGRVVEP